MLYNYRIVTCFSSQLYQRRYLSHVRIFPPNLYSNRKRQIDPRGLSSYTTFFLLPAGRVPRIHPSGRGGGGGFEDLAAWKTVGNVVVRRFVPRRGDLDYSSGGGGFRVDRVSVLLRHQNRQRDAPSFRQPDWIDTGHAHVPGIDDGEQYFLRKRNKDGERGDRKNSIAGIGQLKLIKAVAWHRIVVENARNMVFLVSTKKKKKVKRSRYFRRFKKNARDSSESIDYRK